MTPRPVEGRVNAVREALRCRRQARLHHGTWLSHLELDQAGAANDARVLLLEQLRAACQAWRVALGPERSEPPVPPDASPPTAAP
jgi:hypothetical protein